MGNAIVGIGEILFDLLPQGPQLGGAPANFAYHISRLGGEGYAVSAIIQHHPRGGIISADEVSTFVCTRHGAMPEYSDKFGEQPFGCHK